MVIISSIIIWVLESPLGHAIFKFLWNAASGEVSNIIANKKAQNEVRAAAKAAIVALKDAKTPEDRQNAVKNVLGGL